MDKQNTKLVPAGELKAGNVIHLTGEVVVSKRVDNYLLPKHKQKLIVKLIGENGFTRVTDWGVNTQIRVKS